MKYNIISTGSTGNAVVINGYILIDCGVPLKKLKPVVKDLKLVLLTHKHSDHFKPSTVRALHRERPTLRWCCCEWMVGPLLEAGVDKRVVDVAEPEVPELTSKALIYNNLCIVSPEPVPHNAPNCGWRVGINGEWLFYVTDCGTLDGIVARNYALYMVEANHTKEDLEARRAEKIAAGEYSYETDAARNHLSLEQATDWIYQNAGPNSKYVFLHQHIERGDVTV